VLDACAGTGDLALACLRAGKGRLLLVSDFCPEMLARGRGKGLGGSFVGDRRGEAGAGRGRPAASAGFQRASALLAADAQRLPLPAASVDAVVVAFGVRNLADVRAGVGELVRVLRPGGQLLVLEFFRADPAATGPARGAAAPVRAWLRATLPLLGRLFARDGSAYGYLPASMGRFLSVPEFCGVLAEAGLAEVAVERQTLGIAHLVAARRAIP